MPVERDGDFVFITGGLMQAKSKLTPEQRKARRRKILRILLIAGGVVLVVCAGIGIVKLVA